MQFRYSVTVPHNDAYSPMMRPEPRYPINIPNFSEATMLGPDGEKGKHGEDEDVGDDDGWMVFWFEDLGVGVKVLLACACEQGQ